MIEEIIYTSAPKGLKQGSRGFCTVVSTAGMGVNLAERLESMSGYRHAFPLNDPQASLNPVCFTFVTTRMAGQKLHVISRVADAGQDYSGRTNKLAHHIVVDDTSVLPAGPARVLAEPDSVATSWDGTVATKPPRRLPVPRLPAKVDLVAWKSATGDHGWAGYVAEQLLGSRAPVNIIFKAGTDTLALVTEVFDLIPYPQRWGVTFSTYFTRLLAGTECQLRFYLDGTAEATSIRNDARSIKVDLAAALPPAVGGALVEAARTGILQFQQAKAIPKSSPATKAKSPQSSVTDAELEQLLATDEPVASKVTPVKSGDGTVASTLRRVGSAPPPVSRLHQAFEKEQNSSGIWIIGLLVALLLCAVGIGAWLTLPDLIATWKIEDARMANTSADEKKTDGEDVTEAPPVEIPPLPFEGKSPFHKAIADFGENAETVVWALSNGDSPDANNVLPLLVSDVESVKFSTKSAGIQILGAGVDGLESAKWKVKVGDLVVGDLAVTLVGENKGAELSWQRASFPLSDNELRTALYRFYKSELTVSAPTNSRTPVDELRVIQLNAPSLFGGKGPFENFQGTDDESVFRWKVPPANGETKPVVVYCHSAENLELTGTNESPLKKVTTPTGVTWSVEHPNCGLGFFSAEVTEALETELTWHWNSDNESDDPVEVNRARHWLLNTKFPMIARREDGIVDKSSIQLSFVPPSPFLDANASAGVTRMLRLTNPSTIKDLPEDDQPVIRVEDVSSFDIQLHPDVDSDVGPDRMLARHKDRRISIMAAPGENLKWDAKVSVGTVEVPLGQYELKETEVPGEYRLGFGWDDAAKREVAIAELFRWSPIVVTAQAHRAVFLQREPDHWVIPSWDRQKGFVLEQGLSEDLNRTGHEFDELDVKGAKFTVEFPDSHADTVQLGQAKTNVIRYFDLAAPIKLLKTEPESTEYGRLTISITPPEADDATSHFGLSTSVEACVTLPASLPQSSDEQTVLAKLLDSRKFRTAFEALMAGANANQDQDQARLWQEATNKWISELNQLNDTPNLSGSGVVRFVDLSKLRTIATDESNNCKRLTDLYVKEITKAHSVLTSQAEFSKKRRNPTTEIDKVLGSLGQQVAEIESFRKQFRPGEKDSKWDRKAKELEPVNEAFSSLRVTFNLSLELPSDPKVEIHFLNAEMEASNDN